MRMSVLGDVLISGRVVFLFSHFPVVDLVFVLFFPFFPPPPLFFFRGGGSIIITFRPVQ